MAWVHPWTWPEPPFWCSAACFVGIDPARLVKRARKYGINPVDLEQLVANTDGFCMVCRRCHAGIIEHCHETRHIRGLVCGWCNGRLASTESGRPLRRPVTVDDTGTCCCLDPDESDRRRDIARAAFAYLDHASDWYHLSVRAAFSRLAADPYPPEAVFTPPTTD